MEINILETILSVLLTVLVITVIFRRLRLPVVLGYLAVGTIVGPHALNLIPDPKDINELAEFGIVFLMFTVGLEFSLPKLFSLRNSVFIVGGAQVLLCIFITTTIGIFLGMKLLSALVVGGIVAMSSTAIVVKQLHDQRELHSTHGLNAIGVLLFQDVAVIPFIILIVSLSANVGGSLTIVFLWAFFKGIIAILLISIAGRWLLTPIFHLISKTRAIELFTLTVLLITLTAAWLTNVLGLSYALGAFLAGIMLAETEFRHQIEIEIRPFRDILLGLFFISIGMLSDFSHWIAVWPWIVLLLSALTVGKMLLISTLSRFAAIKPTECARTGLVLAQGGEFGFAILTLALQKDMMPPEYGQVVLAALLLSISISPILIRFNKQISTFFVLSKHHSEHTIKKDIHEITEKLNHHIIICGYGRVGQHIARVLDKANHPYIGLDIDSELIRRTSLAGERVIYGDASHPGILHAAGMDRAKALVISFDDVNASVKTLSMARQLYPHLPILVRCKDEAELTELKKHGATKIIAEIFEESITLSQHLLQLIEMPAKKILELMQEVRSKDYDMLRRIFPGAIDDESGIENILYENLMPIYLPEGAKAIGHKLSEFNFKDNGIEVIGIRRGKEKPLKPDGRIKLCANDILIVYGPPANIEEAEKMLMED